MYKKIVEATLVLGSVFIMSFSASADEQKTVIGIVDTQKIVMTSDYYTAMQTADSELKAMEQKLQIFRNIIELNEDANTPEEFITSVKKDILTSDVIYVYTPKGDVIELPAQSTPVDFAYKVHSEVGDRIVGAIVNDNIVNSFFI